MTNFYNELRTEKFVKTERVRAFINKNIDQIFLTLHEEVKDRGVMNLKEVGNAIIELYHLYGRDEEISYLYKLSDKNSYKYGLKTIKLFDGLKLVYPKYEDFKLIIAESIEGRGTGKIGLTRFVYSNRVKLIDFMKNNSEDLQRIEKGKHVINVKEILKPNNAHTFDSK